jgi:hypothetical protein
MVAVETGVFSFGMLPRIEAIFQEFFAFSILTGKVTGTDDGEALRGSPSREARVKYPKVGNGYHRFCCTQGVQ